MFHPNQSLNFAPPPPSLPLQKLYLKILFWRKTHLKIQVWGHIVFRQNYVSLSNRVSIFVKEHKVQFTKCTIHLPARGGNDAIVLCVAAFNQFGLTQFISGTVREIWLCEYHFKAIDEIYSQWLDCFLVNRWTLCLKNHCIYSIVFKFSTRSLKRCHTK